jgi:hypothetical protein
LAQRFLRLAKGAAILILARACVPGECKYLKKMQEYQVWFALT